MSVILVVCLCAGVSFAYLLADVLWRVVVLVVGPIVLVAIIVVATGEDTSLRAQTIKAVAAAKVSTPCSVAFKDCRR